VILPSKKVLSIFVVAAALVASIIITFGRDKSSEIINIASNITAGDKVRIAENPNWQNELSGLNASMAAVKTGTSTAEETVTDTVSKTLMSNYLALKQSGKLDTTSAQKLVDQTVFYINQTSVQTAKISESQLNVIADNGEQSIADYGENLGTIAKSKSQAEINKELSLITQIIQSGDQSKINELDNIIAGYKKIIDALTKMPVPKTFVKAHLDTVNGTIGMVTALEEMKGIPNDPIKGLAVLQLYQASTTTLSQAVNATVAFIKQNNITYKQGSGGYYLLYGI